MEGAGPVDLMVILGGLKRLIRQTVSEGTFGGGGARRGCG